ncbi:MAG: tryptophan synthase subunit alpha [Methanomassiliicoccaceae archaeon]|nr:tryptophan synthase subunit alpha [Methanomassiliicoccaceae archaeon]
MNKISDAFRNKKAFIVFITGGDPDIETSEELIVAMASSGADIIEIGIPFSDPIAEGEVIQRADERALANGCTVDKLFEMVERVRKKISIPLLFMTYINPIFRYGKTKFMRRCEECGIDGIIVPDLPFEEREEISRDCKEFNITRISMIAPTSHDRIRMIAEGAEGFLYCVSSLGVTGVRNEIGTDAVRMIEESKKVTDVPCAVGFGISTKEQAREMAAVSDGVIIGSAIVRIIEEYGNRCVEPVKKFVKGIRSAL